MTTLALAIILLHPFVGLAAVSLSIVSIEENWREDLTWGTLLVFALSGIVFGWFCIPFAIIFWLLFSKTANRKVF